MNRKTLYLISSLSLGLFVSTAMANELPMPKQIGPTELKPMQLMEMPQSAHKNETEASQWLLLAQAASSKAEAAQIAKDRHGGKVLSVRKSGNGWQVKLLLDGKRVKMVYVEGNNSDSK